MNATSLRPWDLRETLARTRTCGPSARHCKVTPDFIIIVIIIFRVVFFSASCNLGLKLCGNCFVQMNGVARQRLWWGKFAVRSGFEKEKTATVH